MLERFLKQAGVLTVAPDGQMMFRPPQHRVFFAGSFNPVHQGHWELARIAEQTLGSEVAFELSVDNVDKARLSEPEIRSRLAQFAWRASVCLTHAPRFVEKAECLPGSWFVVGADTALRIVSPRYYQGDAGATVTALQRLTELECRFLVGCRIDAGGQCLGLDDVPVPPRFRGLFQEIPSNHFRCDISSTQLRGGAIR